MQREAERRVTINRESEFSPASRALLENARQAKTLCSGFSFFPVIVPTGSVMLHRVQRNINVPAQFGIRSVFVQGLHDHTDGPIHLGVLPLPSRLAPVLFQNGSKELLDAGLGGTLARFSLRGRLVWYGRRLLDGLRRFGVARRRRVIVRWAFDRFEACFKTFDLFAPLLQVKSQNLFETFNFLAPSVIGNNVAGTRDGTIENYVNQPAYRVHQEVILPAPAVASDPTTQGKAMNAATCIPTFRCDSELGTVLISFSRGTQQASEVPPASRTLLENARQAKPFRPGRSFFPVIGPTSSVMLHRVQRNINVPAQFGIRSVLVQGLHDHTDGPIHLGVLPLPGCLAPVLFQNGSKEFLDVSLGGTLAGFSLRSRLVWYGRRFLGDLWSLGPLSHRILLARKVFYRSPDDVINSLDVAFEGRRWLLDGLRRFGVARRRRVIVRWAFDLFEACFKTFDLFALLLQVKSQDLFETLNLSPLSSIDQSTPSTGDGTIDSHGK